MPAAARAQVDITVNNILAIVNTKLLADYSRLDERLTQLAYVIKHWAKRRQVRSPPAPHRSTSSRILSRVLELDKRSGKWAEELLASPSVISSSQLPLQSARPMRSHGSWLADPAGQPSPAAAAGRTSPCAASGEPSLVVMWHPCAAGERLIPRHAQQLLLRADVHPPAAAAPAAHPALPAVHPPPHPLQVRRPGVQSMHARLLPPP